MKMPEPDPNYPGERGRFDDLEPPAPRDQISGVEPAYAKPARPGIGDRIKGWAKETQYRLKEKTVEARRRAEEALRERREYNKARAAFASANRVKMDRSVDTRFWINDEYYIDVDVRDPEAVSAAQKEIRRIRGMVKAQQRPSRAAPTRPSYLSSPPLLGHQPGPYREPPQRRQPSFDFIAGTGGGGRFRPPRARRAVPPASRSSPAAPDLSQHPAGGHSPGAWITWQGSSAAGGSPGSRYHSSGNQRRGRRIRGRRREGDAFGLRLRDALAPHF